MEPEIAKLLAAVRRQAGATAFDLAVVLGSGLSVLGGEVETPSIFLYGDFPCFPPAKVPGHAGRLVAGSLLGWRVLLFEGRHHLYEGYSAHRVTLPVRLAHALGCRRLLLTNAAGGIHPRFAPGDFMFITDHINLQGENPLRGLPDSFLDLSRLYRTDLFPSLLEWARETDVPLHRGILAALPGPSYETPAEIRMLRILGADAVSMSTVPEAIMGKYLGMEVAALSLIANPAAGLAGPLDHAEVLRTARQSVHRFVPLARHLVSLWQNVPPLF